MAKIRKFAAYRNLERPYTRKSKFRKKSYIKANIHSTIVKFNMGDSKKKFPYIIRLNSKNDIQIRHNALEAARQSCNRFLETNLGKTGYYLHVKVYPHHILRENPLASGAGADRMSTGMKCSFGKSISIAARIKKGQTIFEVHIPKQNQDIARKALNRAKNKFPCSCSIQILENK